MIGRWHTSCGHKAVGTHNPSRSLGRSGTENHPGCCSLLLCSLKLHCAPASACAALTCFLHNHSSLPCIIRAIIQCNDIGPSMSVLSVCLSICLPACLSACLPACLSNYLFVCPSECTPVCPPIRPSPMCTNSTQFVAWYM